MLSKIGEHVKNDVAHLARRAERSAVPAIRPKRSTTIQKIIRVAGDPHREPAYAARQALRVARFYDQVHVVALDREVDDAEAIGITTCRA
jgi:hypothetical protein